MVRNHRLLQAVTNRESVGRGCHPVHLHVHLVQRLHTNTVLLVVHLTFRCRQVRARKKTENLLRNRADPVRRNHVARKRRAAVRGVGVGTGAGGRIENDRVTRSQIAGAEIETGKCSAVHLSEVIAAPLVVAEEEQFVAHHAPAQCATKLVVDRRGFRHGERVASLNILVAVELKQTPVVVIRTAAQRHIGHRATRIAKLRIEV